LPNSRRIDPWKKQNEGGGEKNENLTLELEKITKGNSGAQGHVATPRMMLKRSVTSLKHTFQKSQLFFFFFSSCFFFLVSFFFFFLSFLLPPPSLLEMRLSQLGGVVVCLLAAAAGAALAQEAPGTGVAAYVRGGQGDSSTFFV
jgi:hypothetical protein